MKMATKFSLFVALAYLAAAVTAIADSHESADPGFRPVELIACNYVDGKGMKDLLRVADRWNDWMDDEGQDNYWAFTLMPLFHSEEIDFDFVWAGGWADGANMAVSTEHWLTQGGDLSAEFEEVVSCSAHLVFAVLAMQSLPDPWQVGPVEFSNCTVKRGREMSETLKAMEEWVAYTTENGVHAGHFVLFPAYGETSDAEYDFKWVSHYSYAGFGKNFDMFGTGGGWRKWQDLIERHLECDSARVYHATPMRTVDLED